MNCNLLLLACLLGVSVTTSAQKKSNPQLNMLTVPGSAALRPVKEEMEVKFDYKQINAPLPKFEIFDYQNKNTTKDFIETGGNLLLIMFNPTCDHCEDETLLLEKNIFLFKKSKIVLLTAPVQVANIPYFESNVKFSQYPSTITVAIDSANVVDKIFNYVSIPQINIYDGKSHRLLKTFNGPTPIDSLKPFIQ